MAKKRKADESAMALQTKLVRGGLKRTEIGETSEAIFMTSGFCYDSAETAEKRFNGEEPGYVYSRYLNPNLASLEAKLALIEGAERACVMASGMAAVFASLMCQLKAGDHVVSSRYLFSSCHYIITQILPRFGISITLVDGFEADAWGKAITAKTKAVFIETPSNPTLNLLDIRMIAECTKKIGACFIVDNVFANPLLQRPLDLGADLVVYSTTKHMDGQGRCLGGAVLGKQQFIEEVLLPFHRHTGPALSPFNAWLLNKSLETFALRVERQCANANAIAEMLEAHPQVARVIYPGLPSHPQHTLAMRQMKNGGPMLAFEVKGAKAKAFTMMNALSIIDISNNLGDAKSLITHPASSTHASLEQAERDVQGISDGLLRLSVGIEDVQDLIKDLQQALAA